MASVNDTQRSRLLLFFLSGSQETSSVLCKKIVLRNHSESTRDSFDTISIEDEDEGDGEFIRSIPSDSQQLFHPCSKESTSECGIA